MARVILLGDMPGIEPALIDRLIAGFDPAEGRAICVPTMAGRRGNPVLWAERFFRRDAGDRGRCWRSQPDRRLRRAGLRGRGGDDAPFADIDTPEALGGLSGPGDERPALQKRTAAAGRRCPWRRPPRRAAQPWQRLQSGLRRPGGRSISRSTTDASLRSPTRPGPACSPRLRPRSLAPGNGAHPGRGRKARAAKWRRCWRSAPTRLPRPFMTMRSFDGAAAHRNRHTCVLLPIEAVLAAFDASETEKERGEGASVSGRARLLDLRRSRCRRAVPLAMAGRVMGGSLPRSC